MNVWKFLHVACMFGTVAVLAGGGLVRNLVLRSGEVPAIRRALEAERRLANRVGAPLLFAGIGFGVINAVVVGFGLLSPWLITAYVLVALNILNGELYARYGLRLEAAAAANAGVAPSGDLALLIRSPMSWTMSAIDLLLWLALIYTMVMKPFS